jgi:hypothetical protein
VRTRLAGILVFAGLSVAQGYVLRSVVVDGGGTRLESASHSCGLSFGQPVASFWLASDSFKGMLGFWPHPYGGSIPAVAEDFTGSLVSPLVFSLAQATPNPFGHRAVVRYSLPTESDVALRVYNSVGRAVTTLVQAKQNAGRYAVTWDVSGVPAGKLPCGTYFCRLEAGEFTATRKMVKSE